jgi:hypothetical protein
MFACFSFASRRIAEAQGTAAPDSPQIGVAAQAGVVPSCVSSREDKLATHDDLIFWNLATPALQEYDYWPSKLERNPSTGAYTLVVNQLSVPFSERQFTVFEDWFAESVATGRLHEYVVRDFRELAAFIAPGAR